MSVETELNTINRISTSNREAKSIIKDILKARQHILLVPPRFSEEELEITSPPNSQEVHVGLFTSGSTGKPKLIWNKRSAIIRNGRDSKYLYDVSPQMDLLIIASPWHVAGLSWALMAEEVGNNYEIIVPHIKDVSDWDKLILSMKPDMLFTVPSVLRYLYDYNNWFVPRIAYGGAALLKEDYKKIAPHGHTLYQGYGQTEAGGVIAVHSRYLGEEPDFWESSCVGKPPAGTLISCKGTLENPQSIYVSSPTSVYNDWYDTGDFGFLDGNGRLYIAGRKGKAMGNCNTITAVTEVVHK